MEWSEVHFPYCTNQELFSNGDSERLSRFSGGSESTISALRKDEFNWGERYWEQRRAFATRSHAMRLNIVRYCNLCNNIIKILRFFVFHL